MQMRKKLASQSLRGNAKDILDWVSHSSRSSVVCVQMMLQGFLYKQYYISQLRFNII